MLAAGSSKNYWLSGMVPTVLLLLSLTVGAAHAADAPTFETDVQPIFKAKCFACHTGSTPQAGLDLQSPAAVLRGGKSGPAITPGAAAKSLLMDKIWSGAMPPAGSKLTGTEVETLRAWIDRGA